MDDNLIKNNNNLDDKVSNTSNTLQDNLTSTNTTIESPTNTDKEIQNNDNAVNILNKKTKNKKKLLIAATVFIVIALILLGICLWYCINIIVDNVQGLGKVGVVFGLIVIIGYFTIPGVIAGVISLILSCISINTDIKSQKRLAIAFTIISVIAIILIIVLTTITLLIQRD